MNAAIIERNWVVEWFDERQCYHMPSLTMAPDGTLLAVWNGGFLRTVLQGLAVTCAALLALSALGAGLTPGRRRSGGRSGGFLHGRNVRLHSRFLRIKNRVGCIRRLCCFGRNFLCDSFFRSSCFFRSGC